MWKRRGNEFFLRFSGRNDNLGDQIIFRSLVDALLPLGTVHIRGKVPDFMRGSRPLRHGITHKLLAAANHFRGAAIYDFCPPGGRVWTTPKGNAASRQAHNGKSLFDLLGASRMSVGISVIPSADHSWLKEFDWVGVRDSASIHALRAAGLKNIDYFPDLSLLPMPSLDRQSTNERRKICLSFRSRIPETHHSSDYEVTVSGALRDLLKSVESVRAGDPVFYHQVEEDAVFVEQLSTLHRIALHRPRLTVDSYAEFYRPAQLVISNRLHCLLLGASCGAVPVALTSSDHIKLTSLFETIGWKSLLFCVDDGPDLAARLREIPMNLADYQSMVANTFSAQRRVALEILEQRFGEGETTCYAASRTVGAAVVSTDDIRQ